MLTIQNQTRASKIFKCTIFVGYGGVIFFLLVSHRLGLKIEAKRLGGNDQGGTSWGERLVTLDSITEYRNTSFHFTDKTVHRPFVLVLPISENQHQNSLL